MKSFNPYYMVVTQRQSMTEILNTFPRIEDIKPLPVPPTSIKNCNQAHLFNLVVDVAQRERLLKEYLFEKEQDLAVLFGIYEDIRLNGFELLSTTRIDKLIPKLHVCYQHKDNPKLITTYITAFTLNMYLECIRRNLRQIGEIKHTLEVICP